MSKTTKILPGRNPLALVFGLLVVAASTTLFAQEKETSAPSTQVLFNGKSLDGWSGDSNYWSVVDGAIVGETTADNPLAHNTFLVWQGGEVRNFKLRLRYRMEGGNSGIQVRSEVFDKFRIRGYQADMDAENRYTGIWYDEGGRGILVPRCRQVTIQADGQREAVAGPVEEKTFVDGLNANDWNEVVITAQGNRLTHAINGNVSAILIDQETGQAESSGILALQLHQGPPMKIRFRDIELTVLED